MNNNWDIVIIRTVGIDTCHMYLDEKPISNSYPNNDTIGHHGNKEINKENTQHIK